LNETRILQSDNFGKTKGQRQEDTMRNSVFLKLMKIFYSSEYEEAEKKYRLLASVDDNIDLSSTFRSDGVSEFIKDVTQATIQKVRDAYIDWHAGASQHHATITNELIYRNALKGSQQQKLFRLECERRTAEMLEGVHLEQYRGTCVEAFLGWYLKDLFVREEKMVAENSILKQQVDENNKRVVSIYSQLVLLFVKICILKSKLVPADYKPLGDLNNYISIEDFISHIRVSNTKVLLSYSVFGNIQKYIGPDVKLRLNLNEAAVGVSLLKALFKDHVGRALEDLYFSVVNSGEARRLPDRKYDRFMDSNFSTEEKFDISTSKDLLEWMIKNVPAADSDHRIRDRCSHLQHHEEVLPRPGLEQNQKPADCSKAGDSSSQIDQPRVPHVHLAGLRDCHARRSERRHQPPLALHRQCSRVPAASKGHLGRRTGASRAVRRSHQVRETACTRDSSTEE